MFCRAVVFAAARVVVTCTSLALGKTAVGTRLASAAATDDALDRSTTELELANCGSQEVANGGSENTPLAAPVSKPLNRRNKFVDATSLSSGSGVTLAAAGTVANSMPPTRKVTFSFPLYV